MFGGEKAQRVTKQYAPQVSQSCIAFLQPLNCFMCLVHVYLGSLFEQFVVSHCLPNIDVGVHVGIIVWRTANKRFLPQLLALHDLVLCRDSINHVFWELHATSSLGRQTVISKSYHTKAFHEQESGRRKCRRTGPALLKHSSPLSLSVVTPWSG